MQIKIYLVCIHLNLSQPGTPNVRIERAFLTRAAAEDYVRERPGTFIEKHVATKGDAAS